MYFVDIIFSFQTIRNLQFTIIIGFSNAICILHHTRGIDRSDRIDNNFIVFHDSDAIVQMYLNA